MLEDSRGMSEMSPESDCVAACFIRSSARATTRADNDRQSDYSIVQCATIQRDRQDERETEKQRDR